MAGNQTTVTTASPEASDRAERLEERFAVPVILAAVASVPAVFLTMLEGRPATVGAAVNWASLAVLTAESFVLLVLAGDRVRWIRERWFVIAVAAAAVPAVVFAIGPVQLLRLLRFVGALRIVRARRILKAGRILRTKANLTGPVQGAVAVAVTLACTAFVVLVLADPTSVTRQAVDSTYQRLGFAAVLVAGAILGGATFVVRRYGRGRRRR